MTKPFIEIDFHAQTIYLPCPVVQEEIERRVYDHIRATHHFLTDENHDGYRVAQIAENCFSISIVRNENSPPPVFVPSWDLSPKPGDSWFGNIYCLVDPQTLIDRAIEQRSHAERCRISAEKCRDTVRGRKEAIRLRSLARSFDITANYIMGQSDMLERALGDASILPLDSNLLPRKEFAGKVQIL